MKKKFSRILGVGLVIALLSSLMVIAAPVSAGTLSWSAEKGMPSTSSTKEHLLSGSDVTDIAVAYDGTTIYAVDSAGNDILKSTDAGLNWKHLTISDLADPTLVAVAPDNASLVVVAGDNNEVYYSSNGGTTFSSLGTVSDLDNIYAIAVSPATGTQHYIAAGGDNTTAIRVAYFNIGASVPSWKDLSTKGLDGDKAVRAVAFSPAFASDKVMVAITESGTTKALYEIYSYASKKWNDDAGFGDYDTAKNDIAITAPLSSASISLSPTYLGADETTRKAFVGLADNAGTSGGLYRMTDEAPKSLKTAAIRSVDFNGTNLVAGDYASNTVYRSADPLATTVHVYSTSTYQKPGGANKVVAAWAGDNVVAGTSGDSSAFAVSKDNGKTFNDVSLIDTVLTNINDVAVSADGSKVYMVTDDNTYLSLWRKDGTWERVFNLTDTGYIVRLAPEDAANVYLVDAGGTTIYYSNDSGETNWMLRAAPAAVVDMAVESAEVAYVLKADGKVYKTTNSGFIWATGKSTGLNGGATIVSLGGGNLIVGSDDGYVAYSTDGNASSSTWKKITSQVNSSSSNVQVTASGLASGNYIYAASVAADKNVLRWTIGTSTSWSDIINGTATGNVTGLMLSDGTLYATTTDGTDSYVIRTLSPTTAKSTTTWDSVASAGEVFNKGPRALKVSSGSTKLWAINNAATDSIYTFSDTVRTTGPTLTSPATGLDVAVNPVTGKSADVAFKWSRLSKSTAYNLYIAYDSAFTQLLTTITKTSSSSALTQLAGPYQTGDAQVEFMPGTTYYWRVKATSPVTSPYSETRNFTIKGVVEFGTTSPAVGATDVSTEPTLVWTEYPGAIGYEVMVGTDPTFAIIDYSHNTSNTFYKSETLAYSTTYYWRVRGVTGPAPPKKPAPGGEWVTGVFTTMAKPVAVEKPEPEQVVIVQKEPAPPPEVKVVEVPVTTVVPQPIPSYLLWIIIGVGAVLIIALIVLIVRTRRVT